MVIVLCVLAQFAIGQSLSMEIDRVYNFRPSKLSDKEQDEKMPALDGFWEKVKGDTARLLPELRKELLASGHNPYFYFDGAGLLLTLSRVKGDKEIAIEAITKCDIEDIDRGIFVRTLNQLANEGFNVTKPAVKILANDKFSFFIPQHSLEFSQGYCLAYMMLPQSDKSYVDTLVSMFRTLKPVCQKSIITTLWFEYSCKGDMFLKSLITDMSLDKDVRNYAKKILGDASLTKDQKDFLKTMGEADIVGIRAESLVKFSDEAIDDLDMTTRLLREGGSVVDKLVPF